MANSHSCSVQVKLVSESFVKPKNEVEAMKKPYYLGISDLRLLSLETMQKGLLFHTHKLPPNITNIQSLLHKLQHALSISLLYFYPLAGRFATQKFPDEHSCWIYVDCIKGPGARILHATVDLTVSDLFSSTDVHPIVRSFFDLGEKSVNHDGHTRPLLSIQVTELLDGVFIGFTMNHAVADGTSLWHFISTLSEIFLQLLHDDSNICISRKPIYKPFFLDGYGPVFKLPYLEPEEFIARFEPGLLRERIFRFSAGAVAKIKAKANEECLAHTISSFQALSAFLWRFITKARNLEPDRETSCTLATNTRAKINPPLSENHFGNFLIGARETCKVGQILEQDLGWAAGLIHQSVVAQNDKAYREFIYDFMVSSQLGQIGSETAYYKPDSVLIAGSPRFNMYGPEFGLGRAVVVWAGYANKDDGKVTANPGREGGGSVDLEVCLKPEVMNALELDQEFMSYVS